MALAWRERTRFTVGRIARYGGCVIVSPGIPTKFDFVELINPFLSNVARLAFVKFLVLPSLVVDPGAQFGIDSPMGGNETVTMTVLVVF